MDDLCCGILVDLRTFLLSEVYYKYQSTTSEFIKAWIRSNLSKLPANQPAIILTLDDEKQIEQNFITFIYRLDREGLWPDHLPNIRASLVFVGIRVPYADWGNWDNLEEMKRQLFISVKTELRARGLYREDMTKKEKTGRKPRFCRGRDIDPELQMVNE